jgi:hypothetical protein
MQIPSGITAFLKLGSRSDSPTSWFGSVATCASGRVAIDWRAWQQSIWPGNRPGRPVGQADPGLCLARDHQQPIWKTSRGVRFIDLPPSWPPDLPPRPLKVRQGNKRSWRPRGCSAASGGGVLVVYQFLDRLEKLRCSRCPVLQARRTRRAPARDLTL